LLVFGVPGEERQKGNPNQDRSATGSGGKEVYAWDELFFPNRVVDAGNGVGFHGGDGGFGPTGVAA
jgi:hypothetical protein